MTNNIKEDVLDRNGFDFVAFEFENEYSAKAIMSAMDEYASIVADAAREDEAVGFAEWTHTTGYDLKLDGKWAKFYKNQDGGDYDTTDLYQLYLKHKNEKL